MKASAPPGARPVKVGVVTDRTGPLGLYGIANSNVATMVVSDLNARGGLLGRRVELCLEDSATDDRVAAAKARKLIQQDQVDVILGGILSSTRLAIKGPAVEGRTLYIYPEHYEGQESHPLIFCTGPVPAQQLEPFIPWLMQKTGAKKFYCPSADYLWPQVMNAKLADVIAAHGGTIVGEEYFPLDHSNYLATIEKIMSSGAEVVFCTIVPPGIRAFLAQLYNAGFTQRGGHIVCPYFDENFADIFPTREVEGVYTCLDYFQNVSDPFSKELLSRYAGRYPGTKFTAGNGSTGMYRGLRLWEAAVEGAGSLEQGAVIKALDHSRILQGPGGPAEMVPGQHHVRMNMYIAQVKHGKLEVLRNLGVIDPGEAILAE